MPILIPVPGGGMVPFAGPATPPPGIDPRLAMLADTCPHGAGPCGCGGPGSPPRLCGHPDRPPEVWRAACISCRAREEWESGVEAIG